MPCLRDRSPSARDKPRCPRKLNLSEVFRESEGRSGGNQTQSRSREDRPHSADPSSQQHPLRNRAVASVHSASRSRDQRHAGAAHERAGASLLAANETGLKDLMGRQELTIPLTSLLKDKSSDPITNPGCWPPHVICEPSLFSSSLCFLPSRLTLTPKVFPSSAVHFDDEPGERHHADHLARRQIKRPEQRVCAVSRKTARSHSTGVSCGTGAAAPSHTHFRPMRLRHPSRSTRHNSSTLGGPFASTTLSGKTTLQDCHIDNFAITSLPDLQRRRRHSWDDFCVAITGGAGMCDGSDATGAELRLSIPSDATSTLLTFNGGATLPTTALLTVPTPQRRCSPPRSHRRPT